MVLNLLLLCFHLVLITNFSNCFVTYLPSSQHAERTASIIQSYNQNFKLARVNHLRSWNPTSNGVKQPIISVHSIRRFCDKATNLFPFWVCFFSSVGYIFPSLFKWFNPYVTPALALTMISMGLTLSLKDFKHVVNSWKYLLLGFICQYTIMPFSAAMLSKIFQLREELAIGLILVGCAPGGTASNLVTLIAGADVPLSITMTSISTLAAVVMTPILVTLLSGSYVAVQPMDLVYSTLNVVLLPVILGILISTFLPKVSRSVSPFTPFVSVLLVASICGTISASNSQIQLGMAGFRLLAAVVSLHSVGFAAGYALPRRFGLDKLKARTVSIETGMQNSALAVVLARRFANPLLVGLPGALSATCHSIIGSMLAARWRATDAIQLQNETVIEPKGHAS